ncbi:MAG: molybdopterin-dependent oxidoreductase, partial [Clostridia bacterium]|nr:molybdopterin-dependent oxidoreductase [Clostridia bacterium]
NFGRGTGLMMADMRRCNLLVAWGANSFYSNPVLQGGNLQKAIERGAKLIVVDPRCTPTTEMAQIHLRPFPGTDGALALGMARVMITEGLQNQAYIDQYSIGYEEYKNYVMEFTPEKVEAITGVPKEDMIEAARLMAKEAPFPIMITASPLVHNINGVQNVRAITLLLALTGSFGMPGGTMAPGPGRAMLRDVMGVGIRRVRAEDDLSHEEFPAWAKINSHEMQIIRFADYIEQGKLRSVLSFGMNHHMWPRVDRIEEAIRKLDFFVSADIYMTDTCKYADIVLPVQSSLERDQVDIGGLDTIYYQEHVVEPAGEAWADIDIITALAARMGIEIGSDAPIHDNDSFMEHCLQPTGLTLAELKAAPNHMLKSTKTMPARSSEDILKVKTPSGKIEFVSSALAECHKEGHEGLPVYHDYREKLPLEEYPLILSTGSRKPQLFHSRTYRMPWLAKLEQYPLLEVHPTDAKKYGLTEGDVVALSTPVGTMDFVMTENTGTLPGTVNIYHGAGDQDINYIFDDNYLDPISGFPGFKSYCCRLTKKEV